MHCFGFYYERCSNNIVKGVVLPGYGIDPDIPGYGIWLEILICMGGRRYKGASYTDIMFRLRRFAGLKLCQAGAEWLSALYAVLMAGYSAF